MARPLVVAAVLAALLAAGEAGAERRARAVLGSSEIELPAPICFRSGTAEILAESLGLLEEVTRLLRASPAVTLEIQAHSDSQGADSWNYRLTMARAQAIRDFLVQDGVEARRLTAQGYGETCPIAPNTTPAGRDRNRRVVLLRTDVPVSRPCQPPPPPPPPPPPTDEIDPQFQQ